MEIITCNELEQAQRSKRFASLPDADRRNAVDCTLKNVYRFYGTMKPDLDEFQYLSDELFKISGTKLNEITPEELELTVRAMLAGDDEYKACERKMTFRGILCAINRLFAIRYKCKKCEEQIPTFERMAFIAEEIKAHPEMVEYIINSIKKTGISASIKDVLHSPQNNK